ncbi:hypothetical protein ACFVTX_03140 [Agromyces sp. NPDC058136]|uniref:hypothetical protein n=1 Tax=Agromyces sp. NPDC058136 TaxID=3346354 RepID=UPI0036DE4D84
MASGPVNANTANVGDDAVAQATGESRETWFARLDEEGAQRDAWVHKAIATWLVAEHGVDPWWAQHVTVAYEQARGIRRPGQRQDGTYEASVTRTVELEKTVALRALAAVVERELGTAPLALNVTAKHPTARFPLEGGEFVLASASDRAGGRSAIGLTWGRLPGDERLAELKARMREWLAAVEA